MSKVTPLRKRAAADSDDPPTEYDGGSAVMALAARAVAEGATEAIIMYVTADDGLSWWPTDGMRCTDGIVLAGMVHRQLHDILADDDEE